MTIDRFTFPIVGIHALPDWLGVVLTLVWIVAIMNMVNFLDGLDGLAAGVCAISGLTFAIISLSLGRPNAAVLSAIVAGACLGFLRHNFYPARIFMGDSGSLLLGFILATVAIQGTLKTAATVALLLPLLVLAIPIIDTSFVIARRIKHGERVFAPDQATCTTAFCDTASRSGGPSSTSGPGARSSPAARSPPASCPSARTGSGTSGRPCSWSSSGWSRSSPRSTW